MVNLSRVEDRWQWRSTNEEDWLRADGWNVLMIETRSIDQCEHAKKQSAAVPMNVLTKEGRIAPR